MIARVGIGQQRELARSTPVELAALDDHAAERGTVTAKELGGRVHDDICAVLDGTNQIGRAEGVVDHERNAVAVCDVGNRADVGHVAVGIAQRLDENRLGVVLNGVLKRLG